MQPYFLPYIGYFQLIAAVDKFVILDDVNYIHRGWINRNRLLLNGKPHTFTVPLHAASQNKLICDMTLASEQGWRDKLMRTIRQAYGKAPCCDSASTLLERIIFYPAMQLDTYLLNSLQEIVRYLSLDVTIESSSRIYKNTQLKGQERIQDICHQEHAGIYVNPIGGVDLYDRNSFSEQGITLYFLKSHAMSYPQGRGEYVPWLSILDVLMFNEPPVIRQFLTKMDLI